MKKYLGYLFAMIVCFTQIPNLNANNSDELCKSYGQPGLVYTSGGCVCRKPGYIGNSNICALDNSKCTVLYGYNSAMQTNGVCGCKTSYTLSNGKCVSSSIYAGQECSKKIGLNSKGWAVGNMTGLHIILHMILSLEDFFKRPEA